MPCLCDVLIKICANQTFSKKLTQLTAGNEQADDGM